MKKKISVILIIIVTILCIFLGIKTRYTSKLVITQLAGGGNGYILQTSEGNLVIIDGGDEQNLDRLKKIISEKGNTIFAWFITSPVSSNTGALFEILTRFPEIKVEHIYSSLNSDEWYENSNLEENEALYIQNLMKVLYNDNNLSKYVDLQRLARYEIDNYVITPLETRCDESTNIEDQTVVLKVDNTFKKVVFFGNIGEKESYYFYERNKDQLKNDMIQISTNMENHISDELFKNLKTKKIMISGENIFNTNNAEVYLNDEETTIEIW